jgi:hypothetical protein
MVERAVIGLMLAEGGAGRDFLGRSAEKLMLARRAAD